MPCFLFTFHAYRSWREDNTRGYVQRGRKGVQPPSAELAEYRSGKAHHEPVRFSYDQQRVLLYAAIDICARRPWRLHAVATTPTHIHVLVSWEHRAWAKEVSDRMKQLLGMLLSKHDGTTGNRWFSRGTDLAQIRDREHFAHHLTSYLPKHIAEDGCFWSERQHDRLGDLQ